MQNRILIFQLLSVLCLLFVFNFALLLGSLCSQVHTVSPVSDLKCGVGATYLILSWHLPNPHAYMTSHPFSLMV